MSNPIYKITYEIACRIPFRDGLEQSVHCVEFEVLIAVVMKSYIFCLLLLSRWFLAWIIFDHEDRDDMLLRNVDGVPTHYTALYPRM
jgi:hypothetical protein